MSSGKEPSGEDVHDEGDEEEESQSGEETGDEIVDTNKIRLTVPADVHVNMDTSLGKHTLFFLNIWTDRPSVNSVDPDQLQQHVASDQGLNCLPFMQHLLDTSADSKMDMLSCKDKYLKFPKISNTKVFDKISYANSVDPGAV